jgi:hypothetical protein
MPFAGYAKPINRRRWVSQELYPSYGLGLLKTQNSPSVAFGM